MGNAFISPLPAAPQLITKPSPSFHDNNPLQRHHLSLMPENHLACQRLTLLQAIISLEHYCYTVKENVTSVRY